MTNERFASVWDAIEDTPEKSLDLRLRSQLLMQIADQIQSGTGSGAAQRLGISQEDGEDLMAGRIHLFSLAALLSLTVPAGLHVDIAISHADQAGDGSLP